MAHRWGRRGIALLLAALAPCSASALDVAPRAWSVELRGPIDDLRGAPEPATRWVEDGSGNSYFLVRTGGADFGGGLLAGSFAASGRLRWQRFLGRDLDLTESYGSRAVQLQGGTTVFATSTYRGLVLAAYDSQGELAWSHRREVEPPDFALNLLGLTGGADAGILVFLELRYGFTDPDVHHRLVHYDLEGEVVLERELTEDWAVRTASARYLGATGDRNFFLETGFSGANSLVARSRADDSEIWRSRVFEDAGREATIVTAVGAGDGTYAVLGIGADWQGIEAGAPVPPGVAPIFGSDYQWMFAVAKVDAAGQRVAVRYEALPRGRDLDPRTLAASADGAIFVGAIQDLGSRSEPERPVLFAYDAALKPRWRQAAWAGESGRAVAVAALADGGAVLAAPQCQGEDCRLFLARLSRFGFVEWSALGAACARGSRERTRPWIQLGESAGAVRLLLEGPETWEVGRMSYASYSAAGALEWSGGLRAERALALDFPTGLAPIADGALAFAARSGDRDLLVEVGPGGEVTGWRELPGIRQSQARPAPGGVVVGGTASQDPVPDPYRPDFVVARLGGEELTELWRSFGRPPRGTSESLDRLAAGGDRVCLTGSSSSESEPFVSESRVHCWSLGGEPIWSSRVDGPEAANFGTSLAISATGMVAVASKAFGYDGLDLVGFDLDGETLWSLRDGAPFEESGDVDLRAFGFSSSGDLILAARAYGSSDRTGVFAFDPHGKLRWSWDPLPIAWGPLTASGFAEADGKVVVAGCVQPWYGGEQQPFVAALSASDGALQWLTALPGPVDCYWLRLATDGCGEPILAAPLHSTPPGGGVAVLSAAGEIRWLDRLEGSRALLPMAIESDTTGASWIAWNPGLGESSVFLTRYQRACGATP